MAVNIPPPAAFSEVVKRSTPHGKSRLMTARVQTPDAGFTILGQWPVLVVPALPILCRSPETLASRCKSPGRDE